MSENVNQNQEAVVDPLVKHIHKMTLVFEIIPDVVTNLFDELFGTKSVAEERVIIVQSDAPKNPLHAEGMMMFGDAIGGIMQRRLLACSHQYLGTRQVRTPTVETAES